MTAACLRILISPRLSDACALAYPTLERNNRSRSPFSPHGGFPRQDIKNNHVAGFVHKALQRKDAVTADKIISAHIRHLAL